MKNGIGLKILVLSGFIWLAVVTFMLGLVILYTMPKETTVTVDQASLFDMIQTWKYTQSGYRYIEDYYLCGYADKRLLDNQVGFSHQGFYDSSTNILDGYKFNTMGENLIRDVSTDSEALNGWLASDTHKKTLEKDYTHSCLRCSSNLCVQLFAK